MGSVSDKYINEDAKRLAENGRRLLIKAFETSTFDKNKTQNLHDSYGSAVYYNGKLVPGTKFVFTSRATQGKFNSYSGELEYGRYEINEFFNNYKTHTKGFELVTAAAIFYAEILEKGTGRLRRKYRVISGIDGAMNELASKTGGTVININM